MLRLRPQRAHDVIITSWSRQNVMTSFWRNHDIITPCVRWGYGYVWHPVHCWQSIRTESFKCHTRIQHVIVNLAYNVLFLISWTWYVLSIRDILYISVIHLSVQFSFNYLHNLPMLTSSHLFGYTLIQSTDNNHQPRYPCFICLPQFQLSHKEWASVNFKRDTKIGQHLM